MGPQHVHRLAGHMKFTLLQFVASFLLVALAVQTTNFAAQRPQSIVESASTSDREDGPSSLDGLSSQRPSFMSAVRPLIQQSPSVRVWTPSRDSSRGMNNRVATTAAGVDIISRHDRSRVDL